VLWNKQEKSFLNNFFIGAASVPILIEACRKADVISTATEKVELEALSNDAIILIAEVNFNQLAKRNTQE
jgi:hypothetical protein